MSSTSPSEIASLAVADLQNAKIIEAAKCFISAELDMLKLHYGPGRIAGDDERDRVRASSDYQCRLDAALRDLTLPATSIAALRAKAAAAATWDLELLKPGSGTESEILLSSMVEDLVGDYDAAEVARGNRPPINLRTPYLGDHRRVLFPHPDAELIAVCARICQEYDAFYQADLTPSGDVIGAEVWLDVIGDLIKQIQNMIAVTADGVVARARALGRANPSYRNGPAHSVDCGDMYDMLKYLLRDAAALGAGPTSETVTPAPALVPEVQRHPDADLVALCDRHVGLYLSHKALFEGDDPLASRDPSEAERQADHLLKQAEDVAETIAKMRSTTGAGLAAVAKSLALLADGMVIDSDDEPLLDMLIRDGVAVAMQEGAFETMATVPAAVSEPQQPETKRSPAPCIPHPDEALLLLTKMYKRNEQDYSAMAGTQREMSEEGDRNYDSSERLYVAAGQHQAKTVEGLRARLQMLGPIRIGHIAKLIGGPSLGDRALLNAVVGDLNRLADDGLPSIPYRDDPTDQEWMIQLRELYRAVGEPGEEAEEEWAAQVIKNVLAMKPTTLCQCYILLAFIVGECSTYRDRGEPDPNRWSTRKAMSNLLAGLGNIVGMNIMDYAGDWWPNLNDPEVVWK